MDKFDFAPEQYAYCLASITDGEFNEVPNELLYTNPKDFALRQEWAEIFIVQCEKKPAQAGWLRHLALVRATSRAEVDVIGTQLCSCARAIFSLTTLS